MKEVFYAPDLTAAQRAALDESGARYAAAQAEGASQRAAMSPEERARAEAEDRAFFEKMQSQAPVLPP